MLIRFYIIMVLSYLYVWIALAIPYLTYRGLSTAEALQLLSAYNFLTVILEYPTGVVGDVVGYKFTVFIGNIFGFLSMMWLAQAGNSNYYLIGLLLLALGVTFQSGSDQGILKQLTNNIKKSSSTYKFLADLTLFVSAVAGGFFAKINYEWTLIGNGFLWLIAAALVLTLRFNQTKSSHNNIFAAAYEGLKYSLTRPSLFSILVMSMVIGGLGFSIKHIFGSLPSQFELSVEQVGLLVGAGALLRAFGAKLYPRFEITYGSFGSLLGGLFLVMGIWTKNIAVIGGLLVFQLAMGYFFARVDAETHEATDDKYRASVFSVKKLVSRIFSASYLVLMAWLLDRSRLNILMLFSGLLILVAVTIFYFVIFRTRKQLAVVE